MLKHFPTALLYFCVLFSSASAATRKFDVVVYGGTAGGVITAYSAAREGLRVALLEPGRHLGGMVSGGLSWTDHGKKEVIGGYSLEFFQRVGKHYGEPITWYFEPHVAEQVFGEMAREAGVELFLQHRLKEKNGVLKEGRHIRRIVAENGDAFEALIFADASYEGDLMARGGVSYTWGREGCSQYGESLAGVRDHTPKHQFLVKVSPYDANGRLLPEVFAGPKGEPCAADRKVQAYNFRMCVTNVKENQVPFPRPDKYDPHRYELLARLLKAMSPRQWKLSDVMKPDPLKNGKFDVNNNGAFSTDYIGGNWNYPDAGYQQRQQIWKAHRDYVAGFFYFLSNDPRVPADLQQKVREIGLARDEFADNQNWPYQLYVRESRRIVGAFVMSQKDIQTDLTKPDVIGMGSYNSDSHNIQRVATPDGAVENEGDMQVPVTPYQIPYRILLPKKEEVENLLVPVAFSASHVAYSTLRMEPQYMIIGQAAGAAAKMAITGRRSVQDIDTAELSARLRKAGAVMEWKKPSQ